MGAVSRINHGGTNAAAASAPPPGNVGARSDLCDAIGSVPLLHWRGGHLSICQWSRILTIGSLRGTTALQAPAWRLVDLGFGAPGRPPASAGGPAVGGPIMMISPFSEHSAVWDWRPEPGVSTFALVPRRLAEGDEEASRSGFDVDTTLRPGQ